MGGFCVVQSGNILWPENYGVKSATQTGGFQRCLIVGFSQPIFFAARFRHGITLVPEVASIMAAWDRESKTMPSSDEIWSGLFRTDGQGADSYCGKGFAS